MEEDGCVEVGRLMGLGSGSIKSGWAIEARRLVVRRTVTIGMGWFWAWVGRLIL